MVSCIFLYRPSEFVAFGNVFTNFMSMFCYNKRKYRVKKHCSQKVVDTEEHKRRFSYFHNILLYKKKECET